MNKQELISIGVLSNITNVHIQSLRYYEKIGILKPAYTDADTKYRYYTFSQIRIVEAIQYCVELGIPLKEFSKFVTDTDDLDYAALISYGHKVAKEKIESIMLKMKHLDSIEQNMLHSELLSGKSITTCSISAKTYYILPYSGTQTEPRFQKAVIKLLSEVHSHHYVTGYDISLLVIHKNNVTKQYVCTDLLDVAPDMETTENLLYIPESVYHCCIRNYSDLSSAHDLFRQYIDASNDYIIIETDYFTEKYAYINPNYELRFTAIPSK